MNMDPVIAAETASDLRQDIFKTGISLCVFMPICSLLASFFLSAYSAESTLSGEALTEAFLRSELFPIYSLAVSIIPMLVCIILLSVFLRRRFSLMMIRPTASLKRFSLFTSAGLIAIAVSTVFSSVSAHVLQELNLKTSTVDAPQGTFATVIFIVAHVVIAPILEELLFRGIILERLRRYGDIFAILSSAMMFSLLHASFQSFASAFVCGVIFGFLAIFTGSFLSPTIVHALNNALSVALIILSANGHEGISNLVFLAFLMIFSVVSIISIYIISKKDQKAFSLTFKGEMLSAKSKATALFFSFSMIIFIFLSISSALSVAI